MFLDHIDVALKFQYKALVQQRNEMLSPLYTAYAVNSFKFIVKLQVMSLRPGACLPFPVKSKNTYEHKYCISESTSITLYIYRVSAFATAKDNLLVTKGIFQSLYFWSAAR